MQVLQRPDGEIHYTVRGEGFPVLLFAPGGLRSRMEIWAAPTEPTATPLGGPDRGPAGGRLQGSRHGSPQCRAVARRIEADHGWHTYAADHLGCARFHVLGGCIGGSFCLKLAEAAPGRRGRLDRCTFGALRGPR